MATARAATSATQRPISPAGWAISARYFPESVVRILQRDALQRFKLRRVLEEPELLAQIDPDVNLVGDILALRKVMPVKTRETAKAVVRQVVEDLKEKLTYPLEQAIKGSLNRATRTRRPRFKEINWQRTIYRNLKALPAGVQDSHS